MYCATIRLNLYILVGKLTMMMDNRLYIMHYITIRLNLYILEGKLSMMVDDDYVLYCYSIEFVHFRR